MDDTGDETTATKKSPSFLVLLNGRSTPFVPGETIADLIDRLGLDAKGTAVAQNDEVLPRSQWQSSLLQSADTLEVLSPQAGG